jgi:hypothetical protein
MEANNYLALSSEYTQLVTPLIHLIDSTQELNRGVIQYALDNGQSLFQFVNDWFQDDSVQVDVKTRLDGMLDIDVKGVGTVRRVVIHPSIKDGDMFNVYYGESSKGAAVWDTDLVITLRAFVEH